MIRYLMILCMFLFGCSRLYDQARLADQSLAAVELGYSEALRDLEATAEPHYSAYRAQIEDCYGPVFKAHELFVGAWNAAKESGSDADLERASAYFAVFELLAHTVCPGGP